MSARHADRRHNVRGQYKKGPSLVASIAFAPEFSVAAYTYGASEVQLPTALVDQMASLPGPD